MPLPTLCSICEACFLHHRGLMTEANEAISESRWMFKAHTDIKSLIASRDASCTICSLFWTLFNEEQADFLSTFNPVEMLTFLMVWKDDSLRVLGKTTQECWFVATAFWEVPSTWPGSEPFLQFILEPAADAIVDYTLNFESRSTSSENTWQLVLRWIKECRTNHRDECWDLSIDQWYPTRLLDVGQQVGDRIRLVETSEISPSCGYVTLSHCWGAAQVFKLTKSTAPQLRYGITCVELPLTFQHAITITRKLQKQYIWIDSLCIYQDEDDKTDWLREASSMGKVYAHCDFNIAATGAKDGSKGLFATRVPEIELKPTHVGWLEDEYILTDWTLLEREMRGAPLNRRGWVLQERLLAPRILHFGSRQLFWECHRGVLCERFPNKLPLVIRNTSMATFSSLKFSGTTTWTSTSAKVMKHHPSGLGDGYKLWKRIVQSYSRTAITFPSDKLVALSGIANAVGENLNDVYVVGMWRRYLASHLLWQVSKTSQVDGSPSSRDFPYRAPSWSWMSLEGVIDFPETRLAELWIEIVEVDIQLSTAATTGPVSSARLILRGRLRPLQLRKHIINPTNMNSEIWGEAVTKKISPDVLEVEIPGEWVMRVGDKDLQLAQGEVEDRLGPNVFLDVPSADFHESNKCQELFIMSGGGPYTQPEPHDFHEILILRCIDKQAGRFHRLGLAVLDTEVKKEIFDMLMELDDNESSLPCLAYDAHKHSHTIILE